MDAIVELLATVVISLAAAAFSQFGVTLEQPHPASAEGRAVRRSVVSQVAPAPQVECPDAPEMHA